MLDKSIFRRVGLAVLFLLASALGYWLFRQVWTLGAPLGQEMSEAAEAGRSAKISFSSWVTYWTFFVALTLCISFMNSTAKILFRLSISWTSGLVMVALPLAALALSSVIAFFSEIIAFPVFCAGAWLFCKNSGWRPNVRRSDSSITFSELDSLKPRQRSLIRVAVGAFGILMFIFVFSYSVEILGILFRFPGAAGGVSESGLLLRCLAFAILVMTVWAWLLLGTGGLAANFSRTEKLFVFSFPFAALALTPIAGLQTAAILLVQMIVTYSLRTPGSIE